MKAYLAFLTLFAARRDQPPIVIAYDPAEAVEARQSKSVCWVCSIEAESPDQALSEAKRALASGEGEITRAGEISGFELPKPTSRNAGKMPRIKATV